MAHSTHAGHGHMHDHEGHVQAVEADLEYWRAKRLEPRLIQLHRRGVVTLYDLMRAAAHVPPAPAPAGEVTAATPKAASVRSKTAWMSTFAASASPRPTRPTTPS